MTEGPQAFYKLSGSGNDFVFFEADDRTVTRFGAPPTIRELCARGTGVGADGVVFLRRKSSRSVAIRYYNSDGSLGELCGNATLCATKLAYELGMVSDPDLTIETDAGTLGARIVGALPEIDLAPVSEVSPVSSGIERIEGERAMGFVRAGVPHVVIHVDNVEKANVIERGSRIRRDKSLRDGANVNFVAADANGAWKMRTYERGVEGETLACGTGAVATAILLTEWGSARSPVDLLTRSGQTLTVTLRREGPEWYPSLRGNAEIVFTGELAATRG